MSKREIIWRWWRNELADREDWQVRAFSARMRRGCVIDALAEARVHELAAKVGLGRSEHDGQRLARLVLLLAHVSEDSHDPIFRRLGQGDPRPRLSALRFQRLLRSEGDELPAALRRAIAMAGGECNVAMLAHDLLQWRGDNFCEDVRRRWCFDYYGVDAPQGATPSVSEEISE